MASRPVTIADVARVAGVHPSTVSRVLRDHATGRPSTMRRVREAAQRLGYRPNAAARSLARARTMTLGVLLPDLENLMYVGFVRGAQDVARASGYSLVLCDGRHDPDVQREEIERFLTLRVDGVILSRAFARIDLLQPLIEASVPIEPAELLHGELPVSNERRAGSLAAFRRLFGLGHRSVAIFVHQRADAPSYSHEMLSRLQALEASRDRSAPEARITVVRIRTADECADQLRALLDSSDPPTALVAGNDWMTAPLLEATAQCNLSIPGDVSVLAYGDSPWAAAFRPPISVVRYDYRGEGAALARRVIARLAGSDEITGAEVLAGEEYLERRSIGHPVSAR